MRKYIIALTVGLILALSACGVEAGYIQDKEYTEAYTSQERVMEYNCYPAVRYVTYYVNNQPRQRLENYQDCRHEWKGEYKDVYHKAEWHFHLRNDEGDEGSAKVSHETYDAYEVGDYFDPEDLR